MCFAGKGFEHCHGFLVVGRFAEEFTVQYDFGVGGEDDSYGLRVMGYELFYHVFAFEPGAQLDRFRKIFPHYFILAYPAGKDAVGDFETLQEIFPADGCGGKNELHNYWSRSSEKY